MNNFIKSQFDLKVAFRFMFISHRLRDVVFRMIILVPIWFGIMVFIATWDNPSIDEPQSLWVTVFGLTFIIGFELLLFFGYIYGLLAQNKLSKRV